MDNSQCNGAGTPPAEEQVQRVEETVTVGDPQGGPRPAPVQSQTRCRQRLRRTPCRGMLQPPLGLERGSVPMLRTRGRPMAALTEQERERQLRLVIKQEELCKCMNSGIGILSPDQVRQVVNAVTDTNQGPMEALRGLSEQLVDLGEGSPEASSAELGECCARTGRQCKESKGAAAAFRTTKCAGRV
jgi:hypothetical protein